MKARPTIYDVATDAGVSAMSVSRVLAGKSTVSPEMRRRVLRSVDRLGYRRNENARSIRPGQRSGMIGVIVTNIENPYYAQVLLGIEDGMDASGRRLMVGMSHSSPERQARLVTDFIGRQVEGLIVVPCGAGAPPSGLQRPLPIPLVLASRAEPGIDADTVVIDDLTGTQEGMSTLLDAGHRRIGFLGNSPAVSTSQRRYEGYCLALTQAGLPIDAALVDRTCADEHSARAAAYRLVELPEPPTAILCANNQITVGVLEVVVPLARRDPRRRPIALMGVDNFQLSALIDHPLWIIEHNPRALGRQAANLLLQRLDSADPSTQAIKVVLPTTLRQA